MKKLVCILLMFSLLLAVGCSKTPTNEEAPDNAEPDEQEMRDYNPINFEYIKAVWISQFDMQDILLNNGVQREQDDFSSRVDKMMDNIKNEGYNTVIIQARPYADSFYQSELYPVSRFVSGKYGNEELAYDPFEVMLISAKVRNFSVHAWLNPMRAMTVEEIESVPDKYLVKQWYNEKTDDKLVELNGRLYLNPAHAEVRKLIADGAKEVSEKYEIDGVHIDDYFYPTTDATFDAKSYQNYLALDSAATSKTLAKFRYENLDKMVSEMYSAIKSVDERLLFGISPAGNIQTTYENYYTDVYKWCSEDGYIDYICPQIYFGIEHETFDFKKVFNTWSSIVKNPSVRLVVGMTLTKAYNGVDNYAGSGKNEWLHKKDVLKRCFDFLKTQDSCSGISMFSYKYMYDPLTGESVSETQMERNNALHSFVVLG